MVYTERGEDDVVGSALCNTCVYPGEHVGLHENNAGAGWDGVLEVDFGFN